MTTNTNAKVIHDFFDKTQTSSSVPTEKTWIKTMQKAFMSMHQLPKFKIKSMTDEELDNNVIASLTSIGVNTKTKNFNLSNKARVNYIRHQDDGYYDIIKRCSKNNKWGEYTVVKWYILECISQTYPALRKEVVKQQCSIVDNSVAKVEFMQTAMEQFMFSRKEILISEEIE